MPIHHPGPGLTKVPPAERIPWGGNERAAYIKEWYDRGYPTPEGGWANYDIHHVHPREYGGTNDFDNLVPVPRQTPSGRIQRVVARLLMATIADILQRFVDEPVAEGSGPFKLRSTLSEPADPDEVPPAWPDRSLPDDLLALWAATREARLFEDVEYGQWGLVVLAPEASAARTARSRRTGPRT